MVHFTTHTYSIAVFFTLLFSVYMYFYLFESEYKTVYTMPVWKQKLWIMCPF